MSVVYKYRDKETTKFSKGLRKYWGEIINDCENMEESENTAENICYDSFRKGFLKGYNHRRKQGKKAIKDADAAANLWKDRYDLLKGREEAEK